MGIIVPGMLFHRCDGETARVKRAAKRPRKFTTKTRRQIQHGYLRALRAFVVDCALSRAGFGSHRLAASVVNYGSTPGISSAVTGEFAIVVLADFGDARRRLDEA